MISVSKREERKNGGAERRGEAGFCRWVNFRRMSQLSGR